MVQVKMRLDVVTIGTFPQEGAGISIKIAKDRISLSALWNCIFFDDHFTITEVC